MAKAQVLFMSSLIISSDNAQTIRAKFEASPGDTQPLFDAAPRWSRFCFTNLLKRESRRELGHDVIELNLAPNLDSVPNYVFLDIFDELFLRIVIVTVPSRSGIHRRECGHSSISCENIVVKQHLFDDDINIFFSN
jgi:hypothetical protein